MNVGKQDMRVLEIEPKNESTGFIGDWKGGRSREAIGHREEGERTLATQIAFCPIISARTNNVLNRDGIYTIADLLKFTATQLLQIKGFGPKSLAEVEALLSQKGLSLKPEGRIG